MTPPTQPATLDASERALLETLLLEAPVAFAFYDVELRWRRINRALADTNGLPMEVHLGRRPSEILAPELGEAIEVNLERVLQTGQVIVDDDFTAADAATGVTRHWQSQWFPARGASGEIIGVAVLVTDVTERRLAEQSLRRSQERTEKLQQVTAALGTALTVSDVARIILAISRTVVGADASGITLLDDGLARFPSVADAGDAAWASATAGLPDALPPFSARALRSGRPVYVSRAADLDGVPADAGFGQAWAAVPLVSGGVAFAALRFTWRDERKLEHEERVFLEALAGQCALAFERARLFEREHRTAEALQRSLLPAALPTVAGVELAATYRPGADEARVGGDWYDAFSLPDGRLAFVVGDVMGKGVAAAAGMGRMRSALRALAYADPSPCAVLTGLDRLFAATEADEQITTLVYALVDPATGRVVGASAGHPPVVHVRRDGTATLHDFSAPATPLGMPEERYGSELALAPGDLLLAFSDGLVESRTRGIGEGLSHLTAHLESLLTLQPQVLVPDLIGTTVGAVADGGGPADDVTVLGLRWLGGVR